MQDKNSLTLFEALVAGIFFNFVISWVNSSNALPLSDFYPYFIQEIALPVLSIVTIILICFRKKFFKLFLITAFMSLFIVTIYRFSTGYAFRSFVLFVLLFPLIFYRNNRREMQLGSMAIISLLFIFAGLQKINPSYLSGAEFVSGSPFMYYLDLWFPGKIPAKLSSPFQFFPHLSVFVELAIGAGILLRPKMFSHFTAIFLLVMSFVNPPVLNVYFFLLPLLIMANENISHYLETSKIHTLLVWPFFWTFIIYISTLNFRSSIIFSLIFMAIHAYIFISSRKSCEESYRIKAAEFLQKRILIIPILMTIFFAGSFIFLPGPFGFKMFSGKKFSLGYYDLKITDATACDESFRRWRFVPVTDAAITRDHEGCHILFPTMGGIHYAGRYLCSTNNELVFTLKKSGDPTGIMLKCSDLPN